MKKDIIVDRQTIDIDQGSLYLYQGPRLLFSSPPATANIIAKSETDADERFLRKRKEKGS